MAERLHHSADVPTYDMYPASPPEGEKVPMPQESLPPYRILETGKARSAMEQRGADLGAAAGKVVAMVKQARETAGHLPEHPVFERLSSMADNARARAEYLRSIAAERGQQLVHSAREKTAELGQQARVRAADLGRQAKTGYYRARLRANQTAREYPVHVAVAAGVVGFLIGVGLRIRRANRAY
jgi:ElaB/YqjD/DUF883 family membrane-anchored ribosome-binding protein